MAQADRFEQMREDVQTFHEHHPEIWDYFVKFSRQKISEGHRHYSADAIFHRIRWELVLPSHRPGQDFKVNDHHTAFYARRFMVMYPIHDGFFRTRRQPSRSGREPKFADDEQFAKPGTDNVVGEHAHDIYLRCSNCSAETDLEAVGHRFEGAKYCPCCDSLMEEVGGRA